MAEFGKKNNFSLGQKIINGRIVCCKAEVWQHQLSARDKTATNGAVSIRQCHWKHLHWLSAQWMALKLVAFNKEKQEQDVLGTVKVQQNFFFFFLQKTKKQIKKQK